MKPLAPERYKIQFTVSREIYEQLRHAQDLMRHTIPDGDPGAIFERALTLLVGELGRRSWQRQIAREPLTGPPAGHATFQRP